jgi:hypothetical protein
MSIIFIHYRLLLLLLLLLLYRSNNITFRVLKTAILQFFPTIKLHHIILLSENPSHHVYTLDFTPINQTNITTLVKLLLGQNVDAEVRLRYITMDNERDICSDNTFVEKWDNINKLNEKMSKQLSKNTYNTINNKQLQHIIESSFLWHEYMNLYNHNCQHFSKYIYKIYLSSKNK